MTKDTGGPAFPHPNEKYGCPAGMTLRDWFAGQALPKVLESALAHSKQFESGDGLNEAVVSNAYALADAMIAERGKP